MLCSDGPVRSLAELSLAPEHARSHGSVQRAMSDGRIDFDRLNWSFALRDLPRGPGGGIVLAVDVTSWPRPDANTSDQRTFCHTYGRAEGTHEMIPGWAYSIVAALTSGPTSWTAPLDAYRLRPGDQVQRHTARQLREVVTRIVTLGRWREGDEPIRIVADCGNATWVRPAEMVTGLAVAGVATAKGFAIGVANFGAIDIACAYGAQVARELAVHGTPGARFVIDTSRNGNGAMDDKGWHVDYCNPASRRLGVPSSFGRTGQSGLSSHSRSPSLSTVRPKRSKPGRPLLSHHR